MSPLPDPATASPRTDLAWLRHRRRPPQRDTPAASAGSAAATSRPSASGTAGTSGAAAGASQGASPSPSSGASSESTGKINYVRPDRAPHRDAPAPSDSLDLATPPSPATGHGLDLSAPAAGSSGGGIDLSRPSTGTSSPAPSGGSGPAGARSSAAGSSSLDLSTPPAGPPAGTSKSPVRPAPSSTASSERHHVTRRTRTGATTLLDFSRPVVTLDRLQSAIGALSIDAAVSPDVGDFRLGAVYALTDGRSGTIDRDTGRRQAPEGRRPIVLAMHEHFERIAIDLRQIHELERLLVFGYSASRSELRWGGTMVLETYGGDRIDAPIVSAPSPAVLALVTVYVVDGECVVRAEMDPVAGTVRETCQAFGYDRITWLDDRNPVT